MPDCRNFSRGMLTAVSDATVPSLLKPKESDFECDDCAVCLPKGCTAQSAHRAQTFKHTAVSCAAYLC